MCVQVIAQIGMDTSNPGAKLLAKMGFGTVGGCCRVGWRRGYATA